MDKISFMNDFFALLDKYNCTGAVLVVQHNSEHVGLVTTNDLTKPMRMIHKNVSKQLHSMAPFTEKIIVPKNLKE